MIKSPLSNSKVNLIHKYKTNFIIAEYKKQLDINVGYLFKGIREISLYKDLKTGYEFYYPPVVGDSRFYQELGKQPWYYMDWKWEYDMALKFIPRSGKVLEIGCGNAAFLKKIRRKSLNLVGLELNKNVFNKFYEQGISVLNSSIENYSKEHSDEFDMVCSFQVVEHIANIGEVIASLVKTLKEGGTLIVSVPNNNSLIFKENDNIILNFPPHHQGKWTLNSLIKLTKLFPLEIDSVFFEPLQNYHDGYIYDYLLSKIDKNSNLAQRMILQKQIKKVINSNIVNIREYLPGHTLMVIYKKTNQFK